MKDLKECIRKIEQGNYLNEAGDLKNLVAFRDLKEIVEANNSQLDIDEITLSHPNLKGRVSRLKVESGWLYNFWDVERDDYSKEWVFVPFLNAL